jgi:hypothetical protein
MASRATAVGIHTATAASASFVWVGFNPDKCTVEVEIVAVGLGPSITCYTAQPI